MGSIPKKDEKLEKKEIEKVVEVVETTDTIQEDVTDEDKSSEELEAELTQELKNLSTSVPPEVVDFLDASMILETNLRNIQLLDLKITEVQREIAVEGYKGEKRDKEAINHLREMETEYIKTRRKLIKETDLVRFER